MVKQANDGRQESGQKRKATDGPKKEERMKYKQRNGREKEEPQRANGKTRPKNIVENLNED